MSNIEVGKFNAPIAENPDLVREGREDLVTDIGMRLCGTSSPSFLWLFVPYASAKRASRLVNRCTIGIKVPLTEVEHCYPN